MQPPSRQGAEDFLGKKMKSLSIFSQAQPGQGGWHSTPESSCISENSDDEVLSRSRLDYRKTERLPSCVEGEPRTPTLSDLEDPIQNLKWNHPTEPLHSASHPRKSQIPLEKDGKMLIPNPKGQSIVTNTDWSAWNPPKATTTSKTSVPRAPGQRLPKPPPPEADRYIMPTDAVSYHPSERQFRQCTAKTLCDRRQAASIPARHRENPLRPPTKAITSKSPRLAPVKISERIPPPPTGN